MEKILTYNTPFRIMFNILFHKVDPKSRMSEKLRDSYANIGRSTGDSGGREPAGGAGGSRATVEFQTDEISVMENAGRFPVTLLRLGSSEDTIQVVVDTMDGSAVAGEDYVAVHKLVTFAPGVTELEVTMEVINDDAWEPDEDFFVKLSFPDNTSSGGGQHNYRFGSKNVMKITTLNDDEPGTFQFKQRSWIVKE